MAEIAALGLKVDGIQNVDQASGSLDNFAASGEKAEKAAKKVGEGSSKAKPDIDKMADAARGASKSLVDMYNEAMKTAKYLAAAFALRKLQQYADGWSDMQSKVGAAIGSMDQAASAMNRLVDLANSSYSPLQQTAEVYSRNVSTFKDLGRSASQAADFTESLNHALVTTATKGQDADVVINAVSRSLATGRLDALAFDTIVSRSPRVLQAMADQLGTTTSGLRAMAVQGKVTSDVIADGLINSLGELRKEAGEMPATIGDAFQRIQNNLTELVGRFSETSGVGNELAETILSFADGIRVAGGYLASFGAVIAPVVSGLISVASYADIAVIALAGFYAPTLIIGLANLTKSLSVGLVGAIRAVTAAMMANPIGVFTAAVVAAGYALYSAFSDGRKGAEELASTINDLKNPLNEVVESFNKLSRDQQASKLVEYTEAAQKAAKDADTAFTGIVASVSSINLLRFSVPASELDSVITKLKEAKESGDDLSPLLEDFATKFGIPQSALDTWVKLAGSFDETNQSARNTKNLLDAVNQSLSVLSQSSGNSLDTGIAKWDEYVKKLEDARDVVGMNARQLAEFNAVQEGANTIQQKMAGVIASQTDEYKKLQSAIESKDKKAAAAAESNIRALDVERQKVEILAIKTNALIAATNAFASGQVSGDVASGILQNMLAGFAQAEAAIKVSKEAEDQIKNIYGNTTVKSSGGGKSKSVNEAAKAAEQNAQAIDKLGESLYLAGLKGEELAIAQARLSLNEYATPEQIAQIDALASAIYKVQEAASKREKFGEGNEADKYILGDRSPLSGGAFDDQFARYEAEAEAERERYQQQQERLIEARELQIETMRSYDDLEAQAAQEHADRMNQIERAKSQVMLTTFSGAFGAIAEVMKNAQGEQSGIYRAMFAASKAFAVANATVNAYDAISKAWNSAPFPANLLAVAATAPQVMAVVSAVSGTSLSGMAHDGIDSIPQTGTWLLEKGERVTTANTSAKMDSTLERVDQQLRASRASGSTITQAPPVINVIEDASKAGTQEVIQNQDGSYSTSVFVANIMNGGPEAEVLQQTFGLSRQGV